MWQLTHIHTRIYIYTCSTRKVRILTTEICVRAQKCRAIETPLTVLSVFYATTARKWHAHATLPPPPRRNCNGTHIGKLKNFQAIKFYNRSCKGKGCENKNAKVNICATHGARERGSNVARVSLCVCDTQTDIFGRRYA